MIGANNAAGANDAGFFRQMAQRRVGARRPAPPVRPPAVGATQPGFGANATTPPPMPAPRPPTMPGPPANAMPPAGPPGMKTDGAAMAEMGFKTYSGSGANMGGGPMENLFMALPQGTEELFGAAPAGFNDSLRRGGYKGPLANF